MALHTAGPWAVEFRVWTDDAGDPHIAASVMSGPHMTVAAVMPVAEYVANAKLIAAAPVMLAALYGALDSLEWLASNLPETPGYGVRAERIEVIRAAMATAGATPAPSAAPEFREITLEDATAYAAGLCKLGL